MNKKLARDALDIYKKFLIRMDRVADFLKVAEVRPTNKKKSESSYIFFVKSSPMGIRHTLFCKNTLKKLPYFEDSPLIDIY